MIIFAFFFNINHIRQPVGYWVARRDLKMIGGQVSIDKKSWIFLFCFRIIIKADFYGQESIFY